MSYLKTILTYNVPSEAEVDKAFLESHGLTVCLLNANTSRNELGAPFFVQLQVMAEEAENARNLIRQVNPSRFGSSERVSEIDRQIKRALMRFLLVAIPVGVLTGLVAYSLIPDPSHPRPVWFQRHWVDLDFRLEAAVLIGAATSVITAVIDGRRPKP